MRIGLTDHTPVTHTMSSPMADDVVRTLKNDLSNTTTHSILHSLSSLPIPPSTAETEHFWKTLATMLPHTPVTQSPSPAIPSYEWLALSCAEHILKALRAHLDAGSSFTTALSLASYAYTLPLSEVRAFYYALAGVGLKSSTLLYCITHYPTDFRDRLLYAHSAYPTLRPFAVRHDWYPGNDTFIEWILDNPHRIAYRLDSMYLFLQDTDLHIRHQLIPASIRADMFARDAGVAERTTSQALISLHEKAALWLSSVPELAHLDGVAIAYRVICYNPHNQGTVLHTLLQSLRGYEYTTLTRSTLLQLLSDAHALPTTALPRIVSDTLRSARPLFREIYTEAPQSTYRALTDPYGGVLAKILLEHIQNGWISALDISTQTEIVAAYLLNPTEPWAEYDSLSITSSDFPLWPQDLRTPQHALPNGWLGTARM
jgi:hypothetical protein